ncbi:MAG: replication-associated recombination protein A [candidate division SR1 bacterium]|nr:replication-associated recombination protein A [candidate division SR1 bacterium]
MLEPIASFLRPQSLDEFVGQVHLVGENKPIRVFLQNGNVPSMIFRGPPGCGKTTMAHIISQTLQADFFPLSGVSSKKEDVVKLIEQAKLNRQYGKQTIIFLDEIHRWNKAQQDTLLPFVEKGIIILIGATTENPSFTINNALLSRCRVFVFEKISEQDIVTSISQNRPRILKEFPGTSISDENLHLIAKLGNGDLRNALNLLESTLLLKKQGELTDQDILSSGQKQVYYDRDGEEHYNIISAVHKSLRDSDADAACYRIQRMLMGGEDPLYIARRLLRFASEDIGPADNNALLLANEVYNAIAKIGMPECRVFLMQLAIYLAKAKKNNIAYRVDLATIADIEKYGNLSVPKNIRNAPTQLMKDEGYGEGYKYVHDDPSAKDQQHMPDELKGKKYIDSSA